MMSPLGSTAWQCPGKGSRERWARVWEVLWPGCSCHQTCTELQTEDRQWGECCGGLLALAGVFAGTCTLVVGQGPGGFMLAVA